MKTIRNYLGGDILSTPLVTTHRGPKKENFADRQESSQRHEYETLHRVPTAHFGAGRRDGTRFFPTAPHLSENCQKLS